MSGGANVYLSKPAAMPSPATITAPSSRRTTIAFEAVERDDLQGLRKRGGRRRRQRKGGGGGDGPSSGYQQQQLQQQQQSTAANMMGMGRSTMALSPVLSGSRRDKAVARRRRRQMDVEMSRLPKLALSDLTQSLTLSSSVSAREGGGDGDGGGGGDGGVLEGRSGRAQSVDADMEGGGGAGSTEGADEEGALSSSMAMAPTATAAKCVGAYRFLGHSIPLIEATLRKAGLRRIVRQDRREDRRRRRWRWRRRR